MGTTACEARMDVDGRGKRKRRSRIDDDEDDFDVESYFANYVPLSNLPTPPLNSKAESSSSVQLPSSPNSIEDSPNVLPAKLLQPSTILARLTPLNSSLQRPPPSTLQAMLHRARLPQPTIALAACILDALSPSFPRHWAAGLAPAPPSPSSLNLTPPSSPRPSTAPPRKDALVPLAALKLAHAFLHDGGSHSHSHSAATRDAAGSARWWAAHVGAGAFAPRDVEAAVWALLRDLGYALHAFDPRAVEGMERVLFGAGAGAARERAGEECWAEAVGGGGAGATGAAGGTGLPTPEVSPLRLAGRGEDWRA